MPGAFHLEVVVTGATIDVYLLDMQFNNPQIADSSVNVGLQQNGARVTLDCRAVDEKKIFQCSLPSDMDLNDGKLLVEASRDGMPAEPSHYDLPLKWGQ